MTIMSKFLRVSPAGGRGAAAFPIHAVLAAALLIGGMLIASPAVMAQGMSAAEMRALTNQMQQLQKELNLLQRHVYQGRPAQPGQAAPVDAGRMADLQVRLDEMESRLREFTGRIEEVNHRVNQLNERMDKFTADMEFRLGGGAASGAPGQNNAAAAPQSGPAVRQGSPPPAGAGDPSRAPSTGGALGTLSLNELQNVPRGPANQPEPQNGAPRGQSAPQSANVAPGAALPEGSPDEQYKYAFSLLTKSDYPAAERALSEFVQKHPKHPLAGNAQYWLGESYYVRNDFNQAARAFAIGFQKYPKSAKGPDNLLKLGLSLAALGKTKEACTSYGMLRSEFPKAPAEVTRRAEAEQKRLRCS